MAFVNDTKGDRSYDSDRGAALIYKECDRDRLETLELHWKEKIIRIRATSDAVPNEKQRLLIKWNILAVNIPPEMADQKSEIVDLIKDAFIEFGIRGLRKDGDIVTVEFSPKIYSRDFMNA